MIETMRGLFSCIVFLMKMATVIERIVLDIERGTALIERSLRDIERGTAPCPLHSTVAIQKK